MDKKIIECEFSIDELTLLITLAHAACKAYLERHDFSDKKELDLASRISDLGNKLVSIRKEAREDEQSRTENLSHQA